MVLLSWPGVSHSGIDPILHNSGYEVSFVEQNFAVSATAHRVLVEANLNIQPSCSPELLLEQARHQVFVIIECKRRSFGPNSSTAHQARALLTLDGDYLRNFVGKSRQESWKAILLYA